MRLVYITASFLFVLVAFFAGIRVGAWREHMDTPKIPACAPCPSKTIEYSGSQASQSALQLTPTKAASSSPLPLSPSP